MRCRLTIAIPTYNRRADLSRTVRALAGQLDEDSHVLVIDNCSPEPAETVLADILQEHPEKISVVRNEINVGANANILRCIEFSRSPYVWVLSDDDLPTSNCVEIIQHHLRDAPDCAFWKFSSSQHPFRSASQVSSAEDF